MPTLKIISGKLLQKYVFLYANLHEKISIFLDFTKNIYYFMQYGGYMEINRDDYLKNLMSKRKNGQVKVITGIRRCGKSYLLKNIFRRRLIEDGIKDENIIIFELDQLRDARYRNPFTLVSAVRDVIGRKTEDFYLFIDEIQMSHKIINPYDREGRKLTFYDALNELMSIPNLDIYVTGSNSEMLSSDILTNFRGRGDQIHIYPLSFSEYYNAIGGDVKEAYDNYSWFGGMPLILSRTDESSKREYLESLFSEIYIKDIMERGNVENQEVLETIINLLCSSIGSLTNPQNIANAIHSRMDSKISRATVARYIKLLEDAFLFKKSLRYDIKGKRYIDTPSKYYVVDLGLRNARLGFRQQEPSHIMENIIFNELRIRGKMVDVGSITTRESHAGTQSNITREIDFIVNTKGKRTYIQSAYTIQDETKMAAESYPFQLTGDSFEKIIIRADISKRWYDDKGVLHIGLMDFLLDKSVIS